MKISINKKISMALRIALALIFLFSGAMKLFNLDYFFQAIKDYHLIPSSLTIVVGAILVTIEIFSGIFLLANYKVQEVSYFIIILVIFFASIITIKIFEGQNISCGCFGPTKDTIGINDIIRNSLLILIAFVVKISYYPKINFKQLLFNEIKHFFFIAIFITITLQSYVLAMQNYGLKNRLDMIIKGNKIIASGVSVQNMNVAKLNGEEYEIVFSTYKREKSLLFIFRTECSPCQDNFKNWIYISDNIDTSKTELLGIALNKADDIKQFLFQYSLRFPVYYNFSDEFRIKHSFFSTPLTIMNDNENLKVIAAWRGILKNNEINEIITNSNN